MTRTRPHWTRRAGRSAAGGCLAALACGCAAPAEPPPADWPAPRSDTVEAADSAEIFAELAAQQAGTRDAARAARRRADDLRRESRRLRRLAADHDHAAAMLRHAALLASIAPGPLFADVPEPAGPSEPTGPTAESTLAAAEIERAEAGALRLEADAAESRAIDALAAAAEADRRLARLDARLNLAAATRLPAWFGPAVPAAAPVPESADALAAGPRP